MGVLASLVDRSISGSFSSNVFNTRSYALSGCTSLTEISLPNATVIGDHTFFRCTSLTEASFPNAISIRDYAFNGCSSLTTIYVGANAPVICELGVYVFYNCTALTNIYVPSHLVDSYKSATNWSDYADKIKAAP